MIFNRLFGTIAKAADNIKPNQITNSLDNITPATKQIEQNIPQQITNPVQDTPAPLLNQVDTTENVTTAMLTNKIDLPIPTSPTITEKADAKEIQRIVKQRQRKANIKKAQERKNKIGYQTKHLDSMLEAGIGPKNKGDIKFIDQATGSHHNEDWLDFNKNKGHDSDKFKTRVFNALSEGKLTKEQAGNLLTRAGYNNKVLLKNIQIEPQKLNADGGLNNDMETYSKYMDSLRGDMTTDDIIELLKETDIPEAVQSDIKTVLKLKSNSQAQDIVHDTDPFSGEAIYNQLVTDSIDELSQMTEQLENLFPGSAKSTPLQARIKLFHLANNRGFDPDVLAADALNPNRPFDANVGKFFVNDPTSAKIIDEIIEMDPEMNMALGKIFHINPKFANNMDNQFRVVVEALTDFTRNYPPNMNRPILKQIEDAILNNDVKNKNEVLRGYNAAISYLQGPWSDRLKAIGKIYSGQIHDMVDLQKSYEHVDVLADTNIARNVAGNDANLMFDKQIGDISDSSLIGKQDDYNWIDDLDSESQWWAETTDTEPVYRRGSTTSSTYNLSDNLDEYDVDITKNSDYEDIIRNRNVYVEHDWSIPKLQYGLTQWDMTKNVIKALEDIDAAIRGPIVKKKNGNSYREMSKSLVSYINALKYTTNLSPAESITKLYAVKDWLMDAKSLVNLTDDLAANDVIATIDTTLKNTEDAIAKVSFRHNVVDSIVDADGTYKDIVDLDYNQNPFLNGDNRTRKSILANDQYLHTIITAYKLNKPVNNFILTKDQLLLTLNLAKKNPGPMNSEQARLLKDYTNRQINGIDTDALRIRRDQQQITDQELAALQNYDAGNLANGQKAWPQLVDWSIPGESEKLQSVIEYIKSGQLDKEIIYDVMALHKSFVNENTSTSLAKASMLADHFAKFAGKFDGGVEAVKAMRNRNYSLIDNQKSSWYLNAIRGQTDQFVSSVGDFTTPLQKLDTAIKEAKDIRKQKLANATYAAEETPYIQAKRRFIEQGIEKQKQAKDFISESVTAAATNKQVKDLKLTITQGLEGRSVKQAVKAAKQLKNINPEAYEQFIGSLKPFRQRQLFENGL